MALKIALCLQAMDVPAFWDLMCAAVDAADMESPMNKGEAALELQQL